MRNSNNFNVSLSERRQISADIYTALAEARAMARVEHPNLVRVFDVGEHDGRMYAVMDRVNHL